VPSSWAIRPHKKVNVKLFRAEHDRILRLVVSIKLKESNASDILRRFNSYSRQHTLYRALKTFGQIISTLFILRYTDDLEMRQAIEAQLNRIEESNNFTRAVAVGNPRGFRQGEKEGQELAEGCNRLIRNSIVVWNCLWLTRKLATTDSAGCRRARLPTDRCPDAPVAPVPALRGTGRCHRGPAARQTAWK